MCGTLIMWDLSLRERILFVYYDFDEECYVIPLTRPRPRICAGMMGKKVSAGLDVGRRRGN